MAFCRQIYFGTVLLQHVNIAHKDITDILTFSRYIVDQVKFAWYVCMHPGLSAIHDAFHVKGLSQTRGLCSGEIKDKYFYSNTVPNLTTNRDSPFTAVLYKVIKLVSPQLINGVSKHKY